jgi:LacI family transcriptional regulator
MATLADVAKVAGVGVMSVSRVVNGTRSVSKSTEEKVRAAIRRIGYQPNEAAKVLKGQRAQVLGLIVPDIADPFFAVCANAIQATAREAGYMTLMVASGHRAKIERQQAEMMMQRQIAGLIVVPMVADNDYSFKAKSSGLPIVALDRPLGEFDTDAVLVDNREASVKMVQHLIEHGHSNILCVTDDERIMTRQEREAGYIQAMHQAKLNTRICVVSPASGTFAEQFPSILVSKPIPTAIVTSRNLLTVEVLMHLQQARVNIPRQVALISFDDFDAATLVSPKVTAVRQPVAELGRRAVSLLLERIKGTNTEPPMHVVLKTDLILRESCGCKMGKGGSRQKVPHAQRR